MIEGAESATSEFTQPLAALRSCHARIRSHCEMLRALVARLRGTGPDREVRSMAAGVVRYFDTEARFHREDEEDDLLPRMIVVSTMSRGSSLTRLVADIATEHREMERSWMQLRSALQELTAGEATLDAAACEHFVKLYATHIAVEEANMFPLAEMLLSRSDLAEMATSMARRRERR